MDAFCKITTTSEDGFRSTEFSPDGSFLLSVDTKGTVFVSQPFANGVQDINCRDITVDSVKFRDGASVLSSCWYPFTIATQPETCCFLTASRDHPIRLRDAFTGNVNQTSIHF